MRSDNDIEWTDAKDNSTGWSWKWAGISWRDAGDNPGSLRKNDDVQIQYSRKITVKSDVEVKSVKILAESPTIVIENGRNFTPGTFTVNSGKTVTIDTGTSGTINFSSITGDDNSVKLTGSGTINLSASVDINKLDLSEFQGSITGDKVFTWSGKGSSEDWRDGENWVGETAPNSTDITVILPKIDDGANNLKATQDQIVIKKLILGDGADLIIKGNCEFNEARLGIIVQPANGAAKITINGQLSVTSVFERENIQIEANSLVTSAGLKVNTIHILGESTLKTGTSYIVSTSETGSIFEGNVTTNGTNIPIAGNVSTNGKDVTFTVEQGMLNHVNEKAFNTWSEKASILLKNNTTVSMGGGAYPIKIDSTATSDVYIVGSGSILSIADDGFKRNIHFGNDEKESNTNIYYKETITLADDITLNTTGTVYFDKTLVNFTSDNKSLTINGNLVNRSEQLTEQLGINIIFNNDAKINTTDPGNDIKFKNVTFKGEAILTGNHSFDKITVEIPSDKNLSFNDTLTVNDTMTFAGDATSNLSITGTKITGKGKLVIPVKKTVTISNVKNIEIEVENNGSLVFGTEDVIFSKNYSGSGSFEASSGKTIFMNDVDFSSASTFTHNSGNLYLYNNRTDDTVISLETCTDMTFNNLYFCGNTNIVLNGTVNAALANMDKYGGNETFVTKSFTSTLSGNGTLTAGNEDHTETGILLSRSSDTADVIGTLKISTDVTCNSKIETHSGTKIQVDKGKNLTTYNLRHHATEKTPVSTITVSGTLEVQNDFNLSEIEGCTSLILESDGTVNAKQIVFSGCDDIAYTNGSGENISTTPILNDGTITVSNSITLPNFTNYAPYSGDGILELKGNLVNNYNSEIAIQTLKLSDTSTVSGTGSLKINELTTDNSITENKTFTNSLTLSVKTLDLKGNSTAFWILDGSYSIILPEVSKNQTGGEYLKVADNISLKAGDNAANAGTAHYTCTDSKPSSGISDSNYVTLLKNGWILRDPKYFTYEWEGSADSDGTNWSNPENWNVRYVPVEDAKVIISDSKTNYPVITDSEEIKIGTLSVGTTSSSIASITLGSNNIILSGKEGDTSAEKVIHNYGTIVYTNTGRITKGTDFLNDVEHGTVEYKTGTGTISKTTVGVDYYDLEISGGQWENSDTTAIEANTISFSGGKIGGKFKTTTIGSIVFSENTEIIKSTELRTDSINFNGKEISGSTYELTVVPVTSTSEIYIGATETDKYSITNTDLEKISVKNLIIGDSNHSGNIIINESLVGKCGLYITTKGSLSQANDSAAISTVSGELHLQAAGGIGTINTNKPIQINSVSGVVSAINSNSGDIYLEILNTGNTTLGGPAANLQVIKNDAPDGNVKISTKGPILIGGDITAKGGLSLSADGSITNVLNSNGTLSTGTSLELSSSAASNGIGTELSRIKINTASVNAKTANGTSGSGIHLESSTSKDCEYDVNADKGSVSIVNNGKLTVADGKQIKTADSNILLKAITFAFKNASSVVAGSGIVTISSYVPSAGITLSDSDFGKLGTTGGLNIGDENHTGTVQLSNSSTEISLTAATSFKGLTFTNAATINTNGKELTINAELVNNGTITGSAQPITISGNYSGTGTFTASSGNTKLQGSTIDFGNTTFDANSGTIVFDGNATLTTQSTTEFNNITINSGKQLTTGSTFNLAGNWENNGTFTGEGSTIHFAGNSEIKGTSTTTFNNVVIDSGKTLKSNATNGITIKVAGNWTNSGTFTANKGTVEFTGSPTLSGNTEFYNLTHETAGKTITVTDGTTQTVTNELVLKGTEASKLTLCSSTAGTQWNLSCSGSNSHEIEYVDIRDSNNSSSYRLSAENSTDSGNNTRWNFPGVEYTWTGDSSDHNTNWFDSANWSPKSIPGLGTKVLITPSKLVSDGKYPVLEKTLKTDDSADASLGSNGELSVGKDAVIDFANFNLTANKITNNGRIKLNGSNTITCSDITNSLTSTVEYYGECSNVPMSTSYQNIEFTSGATGTITKSLTIKGKAIIKNGTTKSLQLKGDNTFGDTISIDSGGDLSIKSKSDITLTTDVTCDSLEILADGKNITIKGSLTTTGTTQLTAASVETTGGDSTTSVEIFASELKISGAYKNSGYVENNSKTTVNGNITNGETYTPNKDTSLTGDFTDEGTWNYTSNKIIFNGTENQNFNPVSTTTYYNLISKNETGSIVISTNFKCVDAEFIKVLCKENITIDCTNKIVIKGNIDLKEDSTAEYIKINGNLNTNNEITVSPHVILDGSFGGDGKTTFSKNLYLVSATAKDYSLGAIKEINGDLIFDSPSTYKTNGTITAKNIVLYKGNIQASADSTLKANENVILLGSDFITTSPSIELEKSRLTDTGYSRSDFTAAATMPDGTSLPVIGAFTGTYQGSEKSVIFAGKNFYANGVIFTSADSKDWFIDLPDIRATANGFAEAYNCNSEWSHIRCHTPASDDGTIVKLPAYNCTDSDNNKWWLFEAFEIKLAYTVRDNVVRVEFNHPIRNNTNEINNAIASITNSAGAFEGIYKDPDCQTKYGNEDVLARDDATNYFYFYIKSNNSWNTDATGTSEGVSNSTDRSGNHKSVTPFIDYSSNINALVNVWGKRLSADADGNNGSSSKRTIVLDRTGPVLYSVRTGQENHTVYDSSIGADSQPDYDAHNFIEFRYSEPVNFGDSSLGDGTNTDSVNIFDNSDLSSKIWLPAKASAADSVNIRVRDSFGAVTGNLTATTDLSIAGLGIIKNGKLHTGSNGNDDKYVNSLYRIDSYTLRISIAGYTEGTVTDRDNNIYKNWIGYIENAVLPSGVVSMPGDVNSMVTDCAVDSDGISVVYNPQEKYSHNQYSPSVNNSAEGIYGKWDLSEPVFAPLRTIAGQTGNSDDWINYANAPYYEAVGNTVGAGSTLQKIEFHFFDNTPDFANDGFAWLSQKGWVKNISKSKDLFIDYSYCADAFGGSRPFTSTENDVNRTAGGLRFSTVSQVSPAFKYIVSQADGVEPNTAFATGPDSIYPGAKAPLFTGSADLRRPADDPDGLYFGIQLPDRTMALDRSFTVSYDETAGFITDLAGNRLRSKKIKTIDRTPPSYDFMLAPLNQNKLYMVFVKSLVTNVNDLKYSDANGDKMDISEAYEKLIPKCFELFTMDASGQFIPSAELAIDYSVPAKIETIESNLNHQIFTVLSLQLTKDVTLKNLEETYIRLKIPDGYGNSQDPVTGLDDSKVTFIQDEIGNYMQQFTAHSLSDFAVGVMNPLYAYDEEMEVDGLPIMDGVYQEGSWAVHDWEKDQMNYGTLPAEHPYKIVADIDTGSVENDCKTSGVRIFLSATSPENAVSKQINSDLNLDLRIWLPELTNGKLLFMAQENTPLSEYASADSKILDADTALNRLSFDISKEISQKWTGGQQVSFLFGLTDSNNELVRVYTSPHYDVANDKYNLRLSTATPLYVVRQLVPEDFLSLDLWSFRIKTQLSQRGGATVLNNVINATAGEKAVVKVDLAKEGRLNIFVMTLDGNIVQYLNRGQTSKGEHYYTWDGTNRNGNLVARGMYFVRIVGDGIDETRKIMVVKE